MRAERNLFGKQHIESQDEIAEMKRKHNIMTHQIDQLKEEIKQKNHEMLEEAKATQKLKEEMKKLKKQSADKEQVLKNADVLLSNQDNEVKSLRGTLQEVCVPLSFKFFVVGVICFLCGGSTCAYASCHCHSMYFNFYNFVVYMFSFAPGLFINLCVYVLRFDCLLLFDFVVLPLQAEEAQIQQKKVYDDVVNERDVLGAQLIRRNDELALLYEKIKIQQNTLNKGELQYRDR